MPRTRMPTLFISHGGPNVVTDPSEAHDFLKSLHTLVDRPSAIVIASAHFEAAGPAVVRDPAPGMIYDFGGFDPALREMVYPAPGDTQLADRIISDLKAAGFDAQGMDKRGFDHGTWNPLILGFPEANVPVVQVSVDPARDARYHYEVGAALSALRDEGVLIIGSGHITHNLKTLISLMRSGTLATDEQIAEVDAFTDWIRDNLAAGKIDALINWRRHAPYAAENHPTDEHFMPFFFALGAAGPAPAAERVHASRQMGMFAWDSYLFT